jgi:NAD(P)-dependent dehydrogenase (short-subunit alcohol dehydrogenase family)
MVSIMNSSLKGRRALVTGAANGLGKAFAIALAQAGADVAVCDKDAAITTVGDEIRKIGVNVFAMVADVADAAQVKSFVDAAAGELGGLDLVISNAGVVRVTAPAKDSWEKAVDDFDAVVDVNFRGVYLTGRAAMPYLIKQGGDIVNISTDHIHTCGWPVQRDHEHSENCKWKGVQRSAVGGPGFDVYDGSKWAIKGLTNTWSRALASHGVRVNSFGMGATATPMYLGFIGDNPVPAGTMQPEDVAALVVELINEGPAGRTGDCIQVWAGHPTKLDPVGLEGRLTAAELGR